MSETEKLCIQAENIINTLFRTNQDHKLSKEDLMAISEPLKRSIKMAKKLIESFEDPIKETVEINGESIINNRRYYYKTNHRSSLNKTKVESKLKELKYNIEDFYTTSIVRKLVYEIKETNL